MDRTHDPDATSWLDGVEGHPDFGVQNLPYCVFTDASGSLPRGGVRVGEHVVDLGRLAASGVLDGDALTAASAAAATTLNELFGLPAGVRRALRFALFDLLVGNGRSSDAVRAALVPVTSIETHLPLRVGDYTDFYAGIHHALNVGRLFRPDDPLTPNYKHVPLGYHGRASTVRRSGTAVRRPRGQVLTRPDGPPEYVPSRRLDLEVELGVWMAASPQPGGPVPVAVAGEQVGGFCLLNDWSARDLQTWEYRPLGPFLAKNFATTVSDYVVTPEALEPYRIPLERPADDPAPLPYLSDADDARHGGLDITFEVGLSTERSRATGRPETIVSRTSSRYLYWTVAQLIAHHTGGGCELLPGDLLGSGTLSGPDEGQQGSLLEATARGPLTLAGDEERTFLADGDEIVIRARASRPGAAPVGFGECRGRISPA